MKKQINRNILWSRIFADRLVKANVKHIFVSPGSRNTPLIFALSENRHFSITVLVDERTNGFFALGSAKALQKPAVIVTTSGTAVAELYPAIVEAYQQRIPLIICTADRPNYLRNTGANQTINQINIYKNHIREFYNAGLPSTSYNKLVKFAKSVDDLITISDGYRRGPVHINFPFEKPFEPKVFTDEISSTIINNILNYKKNIAKQSERKISLPKTFLSKLEKKTDGVIYCGGGNFSKIFAAKLIRLSAHLNYPILADGTSSLRFGTHSKKNVIINYSAFLKNKSVASSLNPGIILQFGKAPTSNSLLEFIKNSTAEKFSVNEFGDLHDPSRTVKKVFNILPEEFINIVITSTQKRKKTNSSFIKKLFDYENSAANKKSEIIYKSKFPFEGRIINEIINSLPANSNLIISNSTPVRDLDFFSPTGKKNINVMTNRGASGIDGMISTSLGIASNSKNPTFLVIGDLAFYHDINSLQIAKEYNIPIKIILMDNSGGGIFNMLPIAEYKSVFDKFFNTKLNIDFESVIKGFGGSYSLIKSWKSLNSKLIDPKNNFKLSVLHIKSDSKKSLSLRKKYWEDVLSSISPENR